MTTTHIYCAGPPTVAACKKVAQKNRIKKEVAELNTDNIIADGGEKLVNGSSCR